jgi:hypothetical protein
VIKGKQTNVDELDIGDLDHVGDVDANDVDNVDHSMYS